MYEKILVPHAGTKAGQKALSHAKKLAKIHNSKIVILHIVEKIPTPDLTFSFQQERKKLAKDIQKAQLEMKRERILQMKKIAEDLKKENLRVSVKVVVGYPEDEISRIANKGNYDCLVMAKRRKLTGLKSILKLGSVSRKVLEKVSCPIILLDGEK